MTKLLSNNKDLTSALVGAGLWYLGTLLIKHLPRKVFADKKSTALLYAASFPGSAPVVWVVVKAAGLTTLNQVMFDHGDDDHDDDDDGLGERPKVG